MPNERAALKISHTYFLIRGLHILARAACVSTLLIYLNSVVPREFEDRAILVIALGEFSEGIFQLLTGQFADRYGRGRSVLLYSVSYIGAASIVAMPKIFGLGVVPNVVQIFFCVSVILFALGNAFLSGALEAWAVDALTRESTERDLPGLFARAGWIENMAWLVGGAFAIWLRNDGGIPGLPEFPKEVLPWFLVVGLMTVIAIVSAVRMTEPVSYPEAGSTASIRSESPIVFLRKCFGQLFSNRNVLLLTFAFAATYVFTSTLGNLWTASYQNMASVAQSNSDQGVPPSLLWAWTIVSIARILGALIAVLLKKQKMFGKWSLVVSMLINSIPLIFVLFALPHSKGELRTDHLNLFVVLLAVTIIGQETTKPIRNALVNEYLNDGTYRATLLSMSGFFGSLLAGVTFLVLAYVKRNLDPSLFQYQWHLPALGLLALIMTCCSLPLYLALKESAPAEASAPAQS